MTWNPGHRLLFPQYLPGDQDIRAQLLVSQKISTIVPSIDQQTVKRRKQYVDLAEVLPEDTIDFFDPTYHYVDWLGDEQLLSHLTRKTTPIIRTPHHAELWRGISIGNDGRINNFAEASRIKEVLKAKKWSYVASQKIRPELFDYLIERRLAVVVPTVHHEASPVLVNGTVASFIISQLARSMAETHDIPLVALNTPDLKDGLFDANIRNKKEEILLAAMVNIAIPDAVGSIPAKVYASIREEYSDVRSNLDTLLEDVAKFSGLSSRDTLEELQEKVNSRVAVIRSETEKAQKVLKRIKFDKNTNVAVSIVGSIAGGVAGYTFGQPNGLLEGLLGQVVGGAIGGVISNSGHRLSIQKSNPNNKAIERFAAMKSTIETAARRRPSIMGYLDLR